MYEDNNYRPFGEEYRKTEPEPVAEQKATEEAEQKTEPTKDWRYGSHIPEDKPKSGKKKGKGVFAKILFAILLGLIFGLFVGTGIYAVNLFTKQFMSEPAESSEIEQTVPQIPEVEIGIPNDKKDNSKDAESIMDQFDSMIEGSKGGYKDGVRVMDVSDVAEECMPSIVAITSLSTETYQSFFGIQTAQSESSGSGIIVGENDDELLIATNNHVISDTEKLTVQFIDESTVTAYVKGTDADVDLAIIAVKLADIESDTMGALKIAKLGDSDALRVGEPAIAIGNALGYGQSVTCGVISAVNREVTIDNNSHVMIQTDAAINPGNSGGALLNIRGEVIGINEVKISSTVVEGVGYSIPISSAEPILDELMNRKTKEKAADGEAGFLGIAGVDVTNDIASMYGMPEGVYVAQVEDNSAADNAGFNKGYIITKFDGERVDSMESLKALLEYYPAGTQVDVTVQIPGGEEGYTEKTIAVILGKKTN